MATNTKTAENKNNWVTIQMFRDSGKYKDDVFVAINGRRWQIKRGVPVQVPPEVARILEQSMRQDAATAELIDQKSSEFAAETRARGLI